MNDFDNFYYGGENLGYLGGFIEGQEGVKKHITPDIAFQVDLAKAFSFLDNYIYMNEFNKIREAIDSFNHKLFKNPALILISYIVVKISKKNIDPQALRRIYTDPNVVPLLKDNNISQYDILRYSRYLRIHANFLFEK